MPHTLRHLLRATDLESRKIERIFRIADQYRTATSPATILKGKLLGIFFFQESTRTRLGFHAAIIRLGGNAVELFSLKKTDGMPRSESLADTIQSVGCYCDAVVLRYPDSREFFESTYNSPVPVINGGCGNEEHPTQALVDLYAILRCFGRLHDLRIGLVGRLSESRAAKSFMRILSHYKPKVLRLMAPADFVPKNDLLNLFSADSLEIIHGRKLDTLDVVYFAGFPRGYGESIVPREVRAAYQLTEEYLHDLDSKSIVLCPLPRIDEISVAIDRAQQAYYFQQSSLAIFVRMAILADVMRCVGDDADRGIINTWQT